MPDRIELVDIGPPDSFEVRTSSTSIDIAGSTSSQGLRLFSYKRDARAGIGALKAQRVAPLTRRFPAFGLHISVLRQNANYRTVPTQSPDDVMQLLGESGIRGERELPPTMRAKPWAVHIF